jgi:hypothetical protein
MQIRKAQGSKLKAQRDPQITACNGVGTGMSEFDLGK